MAAGADPRIPARAKAQEKAGAGNDDGRMAAVVLVLGVVFVNFFTRSIVERDAQLAEYASSLEQKVALRTAVQDVPPELLASAGLRIDYGVPHDYEDDHR